jgi:hypothetical protein
MKETITSVGIDIGTSTTQLIFSRLTIENLASSYTVPRISIVDKEVIYRSHIYFTPLKSQQEIDVEAVRKIVKEEYEKAGMTPDMLQTGAVIITGETARKQNANLVLGMLSDMAGDFVVATAGPDLESVLSGKGAGADRISEEERIFLGQRLHMFRCHTNLKGSCNSRFILLIGNHAHHTFFIGRRTVFWIGLRYYNSISGWQETVNKNVCILQIRKIRNCSCHIFYFFNIC